VEENRASAGIDNFMKERRLSRGALAKNQQKFWRKLLVGGGQMEQKFRSRARVIHQALKQLFKIAIRVRPGRSAVNAVRQALGYLPIGCRHIGVPR